MHLQAMPQKKHRKSSPAVDVAVGSVTTKSLTNNAAGGVFSGGNGENYRTMDRTSALMALLTNQLGIGILSVPGTLKTLGLIPGVIFIIGMAPVAWYGGYLLYVSVCRYPHVAHVADMAKIVGGRRWGAVTGFFFVVLVLSTCASVAVTMSIALNTITSHGDRTVGFIGIACLVCWLTCVPRTAKFVASVFMARNRLQMAGFERSNSSGVHLFAKSLPHAYGSCLLTRAISPYIQSEQRIDTR
ncbi:hypothetical protein NW754_000288 [Fusarium falciforme]|nr:hypothetical protein NW754_000288 [Fusarium falciforme]